MQHFDELAQHWESPARRERAQHLAKEIRLSWGQNVPRRLLDFGTGTGLLSLHFIDEIEHLYAYDPSAGMREALAQKLSHLPESLSAKVTIVASLEELPANHECDGILISQVLHHIEDAGGTIAQLASLIKDHGTLTVIDFLAANGFRHPGAHHHDVLHHGFTPEQMTQWMTESGLNTADTRIVFEGAHTNDAGEKEPYSLFLTLGRR